MQTTFKKKKLSLFLQTKIDKNTYNFGLGKKIRTKLTNLSALFNGDNKIFFLSLLIFVFLINSVQNTNNKILLDGNPNKLQKEDSKSVNEMSNTVSSSKSEYVLRDLDLQSENMAICKTKLIESYVAPNFKTIESLKDFKWFPTNQTLRNLMKIIEILNLELKNENLGEIINKEKETKIEEGDITMEEIMGQGQNQFEQKSNELRISNRNTENFLEYAIPSSKEIIDICPTLKETCCTEPQFLSLFIEFNKKKNHLLMKVRFLEKIIQILDEIHSESLEKMQKLIDFYVKEYGNNNFDPQDYFKDSNTFNVNSESIFKIIISLRSQAMEQFTEYKKIIQKVLQYYSGFICGICNSSNHGFVYLITKKEGTRDSVTFNSKADKFEGHQLHSMITFDVDVCVEFGESLSKRISFMIFMRKLSVVGKFFEFVNKIRKDIEESLEVNSIIKNPKSKPSSQLIGISMSSSYSEMNSLAYWVGLKQVALFCSEKENFMVEKCINLCRKFFNITHTNFLYDENLLIVNIFNDFYAALYVQENSNLNTGRLNSSFEEIKLDTYDTRKIDQTIRSMVNSEDSNNLQLLGYELENSKIKPLFEEVQKLKILGICNLYFNL